MEDKFHGNEENMSMEEVFEQLEMPSMGRGRKQDAEVFSVQPDGLIVILEGKLDGFVPETELVNPIENYKVGDKIEVVVMKNDEEEGRSLLSERRIYHRTAMKKVEKSFKDDEAVEGRIIGETNSGYDVRLLNSVSAFLPGSESGIKKGEAFPEDEMKFKVIRYRRQRGSSNIVVSLKAFKDERISKFFEEINEGELIEGKVESIKNFGAFVRVNSDVTGLIPASEASWDNSVRLNKILKIGDTVKTKVIGLDSEKKRVSLSLKQMIDDPWGNIAEKYPEGSTIKGIVKSIAPFGFFVSLEPGVEGLVHISEVFWGNVKKDLRNVVNAGEEVMVKVKKLDTEKRTLSLSYREAIGDPWEDVTSKYHTGDIVECKAVKILPTGVILELEEYVSGFAPVSEISWNFVDKIDDVVSEGSTLSAKILSIDTTTRRMRMSLKQAAQDPWADVASKLKIGDRVSGTVRRLTKSGAIVLIDDFAVEAFLPVSQVSVERVESIEDKVNIGDHNEYKIIRLVYEPENDTRNMVISIRQLLKDKEADETRKVMDEMNSIEGGTNNNASTGTNLGEMIKTQLKGDLK